jgi:AAA domain
MSSAYKFHDEEEADRLRQLHANAQGSPIPELEIHNAGDIDNEPIPPREWVFGNRYCIEFVSATLGDGGVGKTSILITDAISITGGRSLTGEHLFRRENVLSFA